jgi:hypothetical protein
MPECLAGTIPRRLLPKCCHLAGTVGVLIGLEYQSSQEAQLERTFPGYCLFPRQLHNLCDYTWLATSEDLDGEKDSVTGTFSLARRVWRYQDRTLGEAEGAPTDTDLDLCVNTTVASLCHCGPS